MYFTGDCSFTKLRKNQFANYENAVELFDDQTILSDQGDGSGSSVTPYDNEWTNGTSAIYRTFRNSIIQTNIDWYYDISNNNGVLHDPEPSNTVTHQPRNVGCGCDCNTNTRIMDRDRSIGRILNDSISFSVHPNEFSYQAKMNVFLAMKADSTLIYQGATNDSVYLNFFNAMKNTNINRLDSVFILTAQSQTVNAIILNEDIADTNFVEYYTKIVTGIYLNGPVSGNELSSSDSTTLETIAYLPVSQAGRAVYIAAAMLGLEVHQNAEEETRLSSPQIQIPEKLKTDDMHVYPNPSNNKIFFNFEGVDWTSQNSLRIYDSKGKLIFKEIISVNLFELNVTNLKPGIYRFMFGSSNEIIFKGNFAVTH